MLAGFFYLWLISCSKHSFTLINRGDHFRFGSVFIKKNNQTEIFFFEKKPKPGRTDRFWFGSVRFFRAKTGSNRFGSVFSVLARFFPCLARFFRFGSVFPFWLSFGSVFFWFFVCFGSVRFFAYKTETEPNRTGRFFQKFNRFNRVFFSVWFFRLIFFRFSRFNRFSGFFAHPYLLILLFYVFLSFFLLLLT